MHCVPGQLIPDDAPIAGCHDLLNCTLIAVVCQESFHPGQRVNIRVLETGEAMATTTSQGYCEGVIDPWLEKRVPAEGKCWAYIRPFQVFFWISPKH